MWELEEGQCLDAAVHLSTLVRSGWGLGLGLLTEWCFGENGSEVNHTPAP